MVAAEPARYGALPAESSTRRSAAFKYAGIAVGLVAVCAVASMAYTSTSSPNELLTDSVTVANKILAAQRFKKANGKERASYVEDALTKNTEHKSGKAVIGKIAGIVAKKNMSYHERMEAMKKLLDSQTDSIKDKSIHKILHEKEPKHAAAKKTGRGRDAAEEAKDNAKAIKEAGKLIVKAAKTKHDAETLHATKHDKKVHDETEKAAADPAKEADWMKDQLSKSKQAKKEDKAAAKKSAGKAAEKSKADNDKAIEDGVKLMKKLQTKHHDLHASLKMSAKDEAERKESRKKQLKPADEAKWLKNQLHSAKKAASQKLALKKATVSHSANRHQSKQQKLIKWAEAHGLPKKLVDNPKDKQKVKDIIARMKADAEVERIKNQMKHDDNMVSGVVHSADPSAAGVI